MMAISQTMTAETDTVQTARPENSPMQAAGRLGRLAVINMTGEAHGKIGEQLARLGFDVTYLREGLGALDELKSLTDKVSALVLDWRSDDPKNSAFVEALAVKAAGLNLPVLVFAAASRPGDIEIVSAAGLRNILTIPCQLADLKNALAAVTVRPSVDRQENVFKFNCAASLVESCRFRFRTPDDVEKLAPLIAEILPYPERTVKGVSELMLNAIEHGNLEIGQERKSEWVARGVYQNELMKRLQTPPYSTRWAELIVNRRDNGVMVVITDQGCGFCWQDVIEVDAPEGSPVTDPCGDGLAQAARESFDELRFNVAGNKVIAFVSGENRV